MDQPLESTSSRHEIFARRLIDNLFAFVGVLELDGTLVEANRAPLEAAGITAEDVIGKKFWDCYWWGWSEEVQLRLIEAFKRARSGEPVRYDELIRVAGDARMWIDFQLAPLRDEDGQITHVIPSAIDITERKEAEAQHLADQERIAHQFAELEALYAEAPLGLGVLDRELRFVRINAALADINGLSVEAHLGRRAWDLLPSLREAAEPVLRRVLEAGEPLHDVVLKGETPARPGVVRHWREHFYPLRESGGEVRGVGIVCEELTERLAIERSLAETSALLEAVTSSVDAAIYAKDCDGRFMLVNDRLCLLLGEPHEKIVGKTDFDFFEPEHASAMRRNDLVVMAKGETLSSEELATDQDGRERIYYSVKSPLRNEAGEIVGIVGVSTDITERKRIEEQLRESEARFRSLAAMSSDWYWEQDEHFRFVNFSEEVEDLAGSSAPSHLGKTRWELPAVGVGEEQWAEHRAQLERHEPFRNFEYRRINERGEVIWMTVSGDPVFDAEGRFRGYRGTGSNITERKRIEEQLRESEARLAAVTTHAPIGIGLCDRDGRWVFKNPVLAYLCGECLPSRDPAQMGRWHAVDEAGRFVPPADWPGARALRGETVAPGLSFRTELCGEERWLSVSSAPVWDGEEVQHAAIILEDITERRRSEEQRTLLMREVNHRAKNLLAVVQAIARSTARDNPKLFADQFAARLGGLAASHDLLVENEWRGVDLASLVRSQLAHVESLIGTRIHIQGPPLSLSAAAAQALGMAFYELATNAAKYGALSNLSGTVEVGWNVAGGNDGQLVEIHWMERDGPRVTPPMRRGFGHTVVVNMVEYALGGDVALDYATAGIAWRLVAPADQVLDGRRV